MFFAGAQEGVASFGEKYCKRTYCAGDAKNGDFVVALIDDSVTVKTFYKEKDYYRLQPENDYMDPIIVPEVEIQLEW